MANQEHISHLDNSLGEPRNTLTFAFVRQSHGWVGHKKMVIEPAQERETERGREVQATSLQMRRKRHAEDMEIFAGITHAD